MIRVIFIGFVPFAVVMASAGAARGIEVDDKGTHWIWASSTPAIGAEVELRTNVTMAAHVQVATVRAHADFCDALVTLNGAPVLRMGPYDWLSPVDVTRHMQSGDNVLLVRATASGGPAAVAVELTLILPGGTPRVIRSDLSWESVAGARTGAAVTRGRVDVEKWWNIKKRPSVNAFDEYNQWEEALGRRDRADPSKFQIASGYKIELLRRARDEEGSWISLAIDPRGRLILGKEQTGLLRLTLPGDETQPTMEVINETLRGCHGLLWAHDSLYANASESKGLFRLRDTDGDDRFDEVRLLKRIPGGTGDHGRNDLALGPDGFIYLIHGDSVRLPDRFQSRVPATREFGSAGRPKAGHLVRTDRDGQSWEVVAAGLRNPYGLDFNEDGELFTYDADSERHVGLPWYRPTRMNHLVFGADYGWRSPEIPWPMYYPDILPPNLLIGRGSPTSVKFGSRSAFPPPYDRALFALDWAFGRVLAVHFIPRGASYSAHAETFLRGRPFNVVDLDFAADGSMYLITGGYKTRSALYRIRYVGPAVTPRQPTAQEEARDAYARELRQLRRRLESLHLRDAPDAVATAWPLLDHADRWIRHASRIAIEHQPVSRWQDKAWQETRSERVLPALLAMARVTDSHVDAMQSKLGQLSLGGLSTELKLTAVRVQALVEKYAEHPRAEHSARVLGQFEPLYPSGERSLDRELCRLLTVHGSDKVVTKTLGILATEPASVDALHYLSVLAEASAGWSPERRSEYFRLLRGARLFQGDEGMPEYVRDLEQVALANVPEMERATFQRLLAPDESDASQETQQPNRPHVKKWTFADLQPGLADDSHVPDLQRGESLFREALCSRCHRLGSVGRAFGPDLTAVSARFSRAEILEALLTPSKSVSSRYRNHIVVTSGGRIFTGQIIWNGFRKSILRIATDPMRMENSVEISKSDIVSHQESPVSPMPAGLLDTLTREEILDLLAYLDSAGIQLR